MALTSVEPVMTLTYVDPTVTLTSVSAAVTSTTAAAAAAAPASECCRRLQTRPRGWGQGEGEWEGEGVGPHAGCRLVSVTSAVRATRSATRSSAVNAVCDVST